MPKPATPVAKAKSDIKLSSTVTIQQFDELLKKNEQSQKAIADFVYERLTERYIIPHENIPRKYKNGFSILANCCLLIETYECFKQGLPDTTTGGMGEKVFKDFFNSEPLFAEFKGFGKSFYKNVRCGILHQGETKKGWTISRGVSDPIFEKKILKINANLFLENMHQLIKDYQAQLSSFDWSSQLWVNCRTKMDYIIKNCQP